MVKLKKVVVIGGGTGTFVALSGLKKYNLDLTAVVSMADSGGSNRIIRDEFGLLPTSDIRQCMVALADANGDSELLRQLFMYRYHQGKGISGMTFGNLFMAALADILGSQEKAIEETGKILRIKGKILPVSVDDIDLVAIYEDNHRAEGEHAIDEVHHGDGKLRIKELTTKPKASIDKKAKQAIEQADLLVLGPGDLYTSVLADVVIGGVPEAIHNCKGKVVYVVNLMTRLGQTYGFSAADHVDEVEKYVGKGIVDAVFVNNNHHLPPAVLSAYKKEDSIPVKDDLKDKKFAVIRGDFVSRSIYKKSRADKLKRSLFRHDSDKLAKALFSYIEDNRN
jgi:uncharacterized cofD-like protein